MENHLGHKRTIAYFYLASLCMIKGVTVDKTKIKTKTNTTGHIVQSLKAHTLLFQNTTAEAEVIILITVT